MTKLIHKYLRHDKKMPHIWCPGCGNGIVLGSLIRAIDGLGIRKDDMVMVSGIGCSGRMTAYVDFNTLHTTHGRALTFATGIKLVKPELNVITVMGDGDAVSIGGNHFIHAAHRNIDLVAIVVNNMVYGMTGGQVSPTTPQSYITTTTLRGNPERELSITSLAIAAGATFVARGTVYHVNMLDDIIKKAIQHTGFSVVEILSNCHTHFGRKNGMKTPVEMLEWFKNNKEGLDLGILNEI
jgi:2-oxoglutarate ferredoxin oxidoreductase subunit beta